MHYWLVPGLSFQSIPIGGSFVQCIYIYIYVFISFSMCIVTSVHIYVYIHIYIYIIVCNQSLSYIN